MAGPVYTYAQRGLHEIAGFFSGWLALFVSLNAAANFFGGEFTARAYRWLLVMELVTLVLFVIFGLHALYAGAGAGRLRTLRRSTMARDRKMPAVLAKVHPRYKDPYVSTLAVAGVLFSVGLLFSRHVDDLARVVNFGALCGFVLYEMPRAAKQLGAAWVLLGSVYYVVLALRGVSAMTDGKRIDC